MEPQQQRLFSVYFVAIVVIFTMSLVISNIIAAKPISVYGWILPSAIILFPVTYILGDVVTEVYGYAYAKRMIWFGFFCNFIALAAISVAIKLPYPDFWTGQSAFETTLGQTHRIVGASLTAYLVGEFTNSYILSRMKTLTQGRYLWARTFGSSLIGEGLDSVIFMTIAFYGVMPHNALATAIVTQWLVKLIYEAVATPSIYAIVGFLKKKDAIDVYDNNTNFNPFSIKE